LFEQLIKKAKWLSMRKEGLDYSIGFQLSNTYRKLSQLFLMRIKEYDLTPEQWSVLYRIREQDGMIQKEIAERAGKDRPTTTRILDLLEAKGLITKELGKSDRRSYHVYITDTGIQVAEAIAPIEYQTNRDTSEILSDLEYKLLMDMLKRLSAHSTQWIEKEKE
jgi:MarR family transcriptional regulator for hemolysin